jgi:hypothetical protein
MRLRHGVAAALTALLVLPAAGLSARSDPSWTDTTPPVVNVTGGAPLQLTLSATSATTVRIFAVTLPSFVTIATASGNTATATLTVSPKASLHGRFKVTVEAQDSEGGAARRTITLVVTPDMRPMSLVGPGTESRWAYVLARTTARSAPRSSARAVGTIGTATSLGQPNLVLLLEEQRDAQGRQWVRVSLAALPNGTSGWVRRGALDKFQVVATRLVIDRASLTAYLYRDGAEVFDRSREAERTDSCRPVLRPRGAMELRRSLLRPGRLRHERSVPHAHRLARRRVHRHPRNESAAAPAGTRLAWVHPDAKRRHILRLARLMPLGTPVTIR